MNLYFRCVTFFILFIVMLTCGCQKTYYAVWEKLGKEKRHLLRDNVQKARDDQQKASEQFKDVLTRIREMYGFEGGKLEKFYKKLSSDFEECESRSNEVKERIKSVEQIASDLFKEWEKEINLITNQNLKSKSRQSMKATKNRYARLREAMVRAESSMDPVLKKLRDYVLYLKHNLNSQAVGALKQEADSIEIEVGSLIKDISRSVKEAEDFLKSVK
ncbi:MAG: DUF2959 domain-containing protein [Desulfobacteraceae bacterium]|nr:DUF2959 domain-containing protein [Desulfobacteraceae bacterium]